jgi:hypothetical protein
MHASARVSRLPLQLRALAGGAALALLGLWIALVAWVVMEAGYRPAPAVFMLPIFYLSLIVWAGVAAVRNEPVVLILTGGLSFLPTGLILLFMPGFARWIGILDLTLVAIGFTLLRLETSES